MTRIYIPRPVWGPVPVFASLPQGLRLHRALRGKTGQGGNRDLGDWIPSKRVYRFQEVNWNCTWLHVLYNIYIYYIIYIIYIYWFDLTRYLILRTHGSKKLWQSRWWDDGEGNKWKTRRSSQRRTTPLEYRISRLVSSRLAFTVTKKVHSWCLRDGQHDQQVIVESSCNKLARSSSFLLYVTSKSMVLLNISWYHSSW